MTEYWVDRDGERLGPFDEARILSDYDRGLLRPQDLLWAEGLKEWIPVAAVFAQLRAAHPDGDSLELEPMAASAEPEPDAVAVEPAYQVAADGPLETGPTSAEFTFGYAGFWVRYGAVMLDTLVILVIGGGIVLLLVFVTNMLGREFMLQDPRLNVLSIVISWLYYATQEGGRHSATLGKRAFHLQVLHSHNLEPFGFMVGTARYGVSIISAFLAMVGYLMQPFTRRKQALHDLVTDTVVVVRSPYSKLLLALMILLGVGGPLVGITLGVIGALSQQSLG